MFIGRLYYSVWSTSFHKFMTVSLRIFTRKTRYNTTTFSVFEMVHQFMERGSSFILLAGIVFALSSCGQSVPSREYEEIVTGRPQQDHAGTHVDPHAFIDRLPPDHPDISSSMQLPAGQDHTELQRALDASVARPPLAWKTPEGWTEEKGSSMRLATFRSKGKGGSIECSIISLGGQAGGLQSNVIRWIRQLNISVPPPNQLNHFLSRQSVIKTDGGFSITIIDLAEFTDPNHKQTPSMMGAIAELTDQTIFVKITGSREAVVENRDQFLSLCKSLKIN